MNIKALRPLGDRVLVNVHKEESDSPIIMPIGYSPPGVAYSRATVVSRGTFATKVKNRDVVIIEKNAGTEVEVKNHIYRLLRETEIVAVI